MGSKNKKIEFLPKCALEYWYVYRRKTLSETGRYLNCSGPIVKRFLNSYNIYIRTNAEAQTGKVQSQETINKRIISCSNRSAEDRQKSRAKYRATRYTNFEEKEKIRLEKKFNTMKINGTTSSYADKKTPEEIACMMHKAHITKKTNRSYRGNTSNAEDVYYEYLTSIFDNVIRWYDEDCRYGDGIYNYNCDFYIPSKDLFIEYQGYWTHGPAPFDENLESHKMWLEKRLEKNQLEAIDTFTRRDVDKLNVAKRNSLNLLLVYPKNNGKHFDYYYIQNGSLLTGNPYF